MSPKRPKSSRRSSRGLADAQAAVRGHLSATVAELAPEAAIAPADLDAPMFSRALLSVMDELLAIDERRLVLVNTDLPAAATLVIGAARDVRALRPEMVEWFGEEMASKVDRLELLADAVAQAHGRHCASETGVDLQPLATSVAELRGALVAEVASLGARKLLVPSALGPLRGGKGFQNLAFDVLQLVAFLTRQWSVIEGATGYSMGEIERAEALANQLITAVGLREQPQRSVTADVRQRAFTLLSQTYDDVRRMVGFLRWKQGDADRIAPSWHRGRKGRRPAREVVDADARPVATDATPSEAETDAR